MDSNKIKIVFLCLLFVACNPLKKEVTHEPIVNFSISPNTDNFKIGDTIWLQCNSSVWLKDYLYPTMQQYNYSKVPLINNYHIGITDFLLKDSTLLILDSILPSLSNFDTIGKQGTMIGNNGSYLLNMQIVNDSFKFMFGIIPKDTGLHMLIFGYTKPITGDRLYPIIDIQANDKSEHNLMGIAPLINNGVSTKDRALKKGFKFKTQYKSEIQLWAYDNSCFYFNVVP